MSAFSFHIMTFGCKVTQYECQTQREKWLSLGGVECDDPAQADLVLMATCAVTAEAVSDARQMARKLSRIAPRSKVVVTGCAVSAAPEDFSFPNVVARIPQTSRARLLELDPLELIGREEVLDIEAATFKGRRAYPPFQIDSFRRARPVLKVQDGCSHGCTYCIVPLTRGPACSRKPDEAVAEARRLLDSGHREIMISGVNLRQYHSEGLNFWKLLKRIDDNLAPEWAGRARLRLSSLEPAQLDDEALDVLAGCRMLCPHLHLSLQSGSPSVLARMGREHYSPEQVENIVARLREFWPEFGLGADILMGFPGESEEETQETIDMVELLPMTYAHVFPYSIRPGTKAAKMSGHLPKAVRHEHAARVRAVIQRKQKEFLQRQMKRESMLVAFDGNGSAHGLNDCYVSCSLAEKARLPQSHELLAVRPVEEGEGRLFVELL